MKYEEAKKIVVELCDQKIIELDNKIKDWKREIASRKERLIYAENALNEVEKDCSVWQHSKTHALLLRDKKK